MATTTSRLGLTKPDLTDVVDIAQLNTNADKIDAAIGLTVCTSGTRPSTPFSGQVIYETDTKLTWVYESGSWKFQGGSIPIVGSDSARNTLFPSPTHGAAVWRTDLGWEERYYTLYNSSTNPGGASVAGWYPVDGRTPSGFFSKASSQTLAANTATAVTLDASSDLQAITLVTNTKVTVSRAGKYLITASASINNTSVGNLWLRFNGTSSTPIAYATNRSGASVVLYTKLVNMAANDYVELMAQTDGAFPVTGATFEIQYLSPRSV